MTQEKFEKWEIGLPVANTLYTMLLHHGDEGLVLRLEESTRRKRIIEVRFHRPLSYRSTDEGNRFKDMDAISRVDSSFIIVENSAFLQWFHEQTLGIHLQRGIHHYLVATADDCIDVLTDSVPIIEYVESA